MKTVSYAQRRFWFMQQLRGHSPMYNWGIAFRITGPVDQEAMAAAMSGVIERHEILRTVYREVDGEVRQMLLDLPVASPLKIVKTSSGQVTEAVETSVIEPFDLTADPPIRAALFELEEDDYLLLLVFHHIAVDNWSVQLLLRELSASYAARRAGSAPRFAPTAVSYADYAAWQQAVLGDPADEGSLLAQDLAFWREGLADLPEQLDLPFDRAYSETAEHRSGSVNFSVGVESHRLLSDLAESTNSSMFMVAEAAVGAWLARLSAGDDIPVGTPYAGRDDEGLEDVVGCFLNTLVLRNDLSGDPAFEDVVCRTRDTTLAAFDHSAAPFDLIVEDVNPTRSADRNPFFQVMYVWSTEQDAGSAGELDLEGAQTTPLSIAEGSAKFDLTFYLSERRIDGRPAGISGQLEYDESLFNPETAESLTRMFTDLLAQVAAEPSRRLSEIGLLGAEERRLVVETWNDTTVALSQADLPSLFSAQVRRSPDAVAVESDDVTLTYAELNMHANRLAHLLIRRGAGPETSVAVIAPRAPALITMLAVFKAGATFLPIDPAYPAERISYILDDAKPGLVVVDESEFNGDTVLVLGRPDTVAALHMCPESDPGAEDRTAPLSQDSPAYIIYTSGSTGQPKGVVVTAKALINLVSWQIKEINCPPGTRVCQFSAVTFDLFEDEILSALFAGQTVVIPSEDVRRDPAELVAWLRRREVNEFLATDSVVRSVIDEVVEQSLKMEHLHMLVQGGEPFQLTEQMREFRRHHSEFQVWNTYGPSETHAVTGLRLSADPDSWPTVAPIGKPIWNCQTYVLDAQLRPVPVGLAGELYLAGAQLARGYLGRPGLTSERFVANPFGGPGTRMYRTGDVVRWNRKGELVFIGRADDQIKIRGIRIELNEINSVLRRHPHVAQAATTLRESASGDKKLVAYVVPVAPHRPGPLELRRHAAALLPSAMVPSAFVTLDELPINSNGKLDRLALPAPDLTPQTARAGRNPASPLEETLCAVFADILNVREVGVDDSFFDLGGHSMLAVRLVKQVRATLNAELGIRALFENPTVAMLAAVVLSTAEEPGHRAVTPMPRPQHVPLSLGQQRLWFIDQLDGPSGRYNIPLLQLRIRGRLDQTALEAALVDVLARHESLRTVFPAVDGRPFQKIIPVEEIPMNVACSQVQPEELVGHVTRVCRYEFDIAKELLVRAEVFSLSPDEHAFVLVVHHIVADGWSIAPLCRDLSRAYAARLAGRAPGFEPLPVQYADFTLWQREVLGREGGPGSILTRQSGVWRRALAGLPDVLELPSDRPRPEEISSRGASVAFGVDADLYARVKSLAVAERATPFMVLQAAVVTLLTRSGAGTDIPLGTIVAGRSDALLDDLIGCFVNTVVLRNDTSGDPTFRELLARTRETDLQAFQNQDVPFDYLVEILNPARSRSHHPLFQVMLAMETGDRDLWLPGLELCPLPREISSTSKFDLTFAFAERPETNSLDAVMEYSTDLFDRGTVETLAVRLVALLDAALAEPNMRIKELAWN